MADELTPTYVGGRALLSGHLTYIPDRMTRDARRPVHGPG